MAEMPNAYHYGLSNLMMTSEKNNLVIIRAGRKSLHRNWLNQPYSERSFDVIVSYFDEQAFHEHIEEEGVTPFYLKGGKWDGIYHTIMHFDGVIDQYRYVWLPDDDIDCVGADVVALFDLMQVQDIKVGQPSLSLNSYFTHFLLLHCPAFKLRYTNFIEVMVPCLRADILKEVLPEFAKSMSGFGLDYVWCRLKAVGRNGAAIFDTIQVHHTRPVGNVLMSTMKKDGKHPKEEEFALASRYGVDMTTTPIAYEGITTSGKVISGKRKMGLCMLAGYFKAIRTQPANNREFGPSKLIQIIRRQLTRPYDLSPVSNQEK